MNIDVYPEFGIELALAIPYAYWLHENNNLDEVITSKGMRPFYYFCDSVNEKHSERSIDNHQALKKIPNKWCHHNSLAVLGKDYSELTEKEKESVNGVLDYKSWKCPPYKEFYKNKEFIFGDKTVFITNKFNIEHGHAPAGFFDIECLYNMFDHFREKEYTVIYKRVTNREAEFAIDMNEMLTLQNNIGDITADVEGIGHITDFKLCEYFDNVINFEDIIKDSDYSYNETQLKVMANCDDFISVCGGNAILSSMFGGNVIIYVHTGRELRPNYFGKNCYFKKLSNANIFPVFDRSVMKTGIHDYSELLTKMKEYF